MIRDGFLSAAERGALIAVARDGLAEHRVARRANAIVLLNDGWNCDEVASALLLDDDTVREWFRVYERQGLAGLSGFGHEGSSCQLTDEQQMALKALVTARVPRSSNAIGAWLRKNYELSYSHSGLIALLHRLGFVYHKPVRVPRKLDVAQQQAFIESYDKLLNRLEPDESVVFVDAVHPTHQTRPAGCWAPKDVTIGIEQTTGRHRLNIHGAINLETGQTQMLQVPKVDAMSLIALLVAIEAVYSGKKWIHVFLDNATYHHAILVREWLKQPGRRIRLHFTPSYCPHLAPIERCWGLMHEHVTHNQSYETLAQFRLAIMTFLRRTIPKKWDRFRDRITDNFRVISPDDFRLVA
jgi:transposase